MNRRGLRLCMYHKKRSQGSLLLHFGRLVTGLLFGNYHRRLRSQSSSIFPDTFFYHDSTMPQIPAFCITRIIAKSLNSNQSQSYLDGLLCGFSLPEDTLTIDFINSLPIYCRNLRDTIPCCFATVARILVNLCARRLPLEKTSY